MNRARAFRACAEWLVACLRLGWPRSALPKLEALWWQYNKHPDEHQGQAKRGEGT